MEPFSKRNRPAPTVFSYELPSKARLRTWQHMDQIACEKSNSGIFWKKVEKRILREEGCLIAHEPLRGEPAVESHFMKCGYAEALDVLEYYFQLSPHSNLERAVLSINNVLRQEGIGWELTPLRTNRGSYQYPQVIRKDGEYIHNEVIRPCLEALSNPELSVASEEMLKAHESYRHGDYTGTITNAVSALESVFKTICHLRVWSFNPDKDTLKPLVESCQTNNLFPGFYGEIFKAIGTGADRLAARLACSCSFG